MYTEGLLALRIVDPCSTEQSVQSSTKKSEKPALPFDEVVFDWSRTWAEVMQLVKNKHYKVNTPEKGMAKAINEFLNHLDPHSAFLDPETYTRMLESTSGDFWYWHRHRNTRKTKDTYF